MQSPSIGKRKREQLHLGNITQYSVCARCWDKIFSTQRYQDICSGAGEMLWLCYSVTVAEIQRSATAGCSWCGFLCDIARFRRRCLSYTVGVKISEPRFYSGGAPMSLPRGLQSLEQMHLTLDGTDLIIDVVPDKPDTVPSLPDEKGTILSLPEKEGTALGQLGTSFEIIKKCIDECSCERSQQDPSREQLPTRLVDLQPEASSYGAKLIPADKSLTPYVTLSYCWGMQQRNETTASNVVARMQGLDESELPRTIRDAFIITRQLGYRYIWVDALCITQNSPEDKLKELGRMTSIYEHAALTIFAASAHHADEGVLRQYPVLPSAARMPFWNTDGGATLVKFQAIAEVKCREDEPGFKRAWIFQEQMLSKRVLTYKTSGVEYRCTAGNRDINELGHFTLWIGYAFREFSSASLATHTCFNMKTWLKLMKMYTCGKITFDEDRLLAIAGIAEKFQGVSRAPYVAGIFINDSLSHQLMWTVNSGDDEFAQDLTTYIAPSWSWASHKSPISYDDIVTPFDTFKYSRYEATLKYTDLCYGPVTSARLHVKGQLRKVIDYSGTNKGKKYSWHNKFKFDDDASCYAYIDKRQSLYRKTEWFCLPMLWVEEIDSVGISGLVISPITETGVFRRIGSFSWASAESFDNLDQQDIVLV